MIGETYHLEQADDLRYFYFLSEGSKGLIPKVVVYDYTRRNTYNLGFGDLRGGRIDDKVVSDNDDLSKVLNTVAKTVYLYTNLYPDRKIEIKPVDERRYRVYNRIFRRRFEEIKPNFIVQGLTKTGWEDYKPEKDYLGFELTRQK